MQFTQLGIHSKKNTKKIMRGSQTQTEIGYTNAEKEIRLNVWKCVVNVLKFQ